MRKLHYQSILVVILLCLEALMPVAHASGSDLSGARSQRTTLPGSPLPLSEYPRPKNDNGLGIHWSTNIYGQSDKVTDYFVNELAEMGFKWVKFLNDQVDGRAYDYLVQQLVARDIMPVMRIYVACNDPLDLGALGRMLDHYVPMGLVYYELYNEPNISGYDGGWCKNEPPDAAYLESIWALAAREIIARGGYPSLPSFFPTGKGVPGWENSFFQQFLHTLKDRGDTDILYRSWSAIHNYMINHPPDYPRDEVNLTGRPLTAIEIKRYHLDRAQAQAINDARARQYEPGGYFVGDDPTEDMTNFQQFIAYHDQFVEIFGFEIPIISTEGGATVGSCEDPRYPCVDEQMQKDWTLQAYEYMLDGAPAYYFATCTWLLAQQALDYLGGPVWEGNTWYHDRKDDHLPIVAALKDHPRYGDARGGQKAAKPPKSKTRVSDTHPAATAGLSGLASYPRPPQDNGRGVHYAPAIVAQSQDKVDFFVREMVDMNMKWVKLIQGDAPKVEHEYLIRQLVANGIEPILRVYKLYNEPYQYLSDLTSGAVVMGVHYFETYNEPNIAGVPGGWREGQSVSPDIIVDLWIPAAEAIQQAGGYSGLPSLATGGNYDDLRFFEAFLDGLIARDRADLLRRSWIPLHNYFLNHPFDYPAEPVNLQGEPLSQAEIDKRHLTPEQVQAINHARATARQPGGYYVGDTILQDSNSFRKFDAYAYLFYQRFGYVIPIISTEGGAMAGDNQDPRYPPVTDDDVTRLTLQGYHALLDDAPAYYFAFVPWLLANQAGEHWDAAWEAAAWYKIDGSTLPVVPALKTDPRRLETRNRQAGSTTALASATAGAPDKAEAVQPGMDSLSVKIIPVEGREPAWDVIDAAWKPASGPYPRIRVNVLDAGGRNKKGAQLRVSWSGGWTMLVTGQVGTQDNSFAMTAPADVYVVSIAGAKGQAVVAQGADGHDLHVTFRQQAAAKK
jgi:hypothetical protein